MGRGDADEAVKTIGWEARLMRWAATRLRMPFRWGETDCCILCLEAVDAIAGSSLAAEHRGRYASAAEALRYQRRRTNLLRALADAGGIFPLRRFETPARGDILVAPGGGFFCGHVCLGEHALSAWPGQGVGLGLTAAAAALPGVILLRIP